MQIGHLNNFQPPLMENPSGGESIQEEKGADFVGRITKTDPTILHLGSVFHAAGIKNTGPNKYEAKVSADYRLPDSVGRLKGITATIEDGTLKISVTPQAARASRPQGSLEI